MMAADLWAGAIVAGMFAAGILATVAAIRWTERRERRRAASAVKEWTEANDIAGALASAIENHRFFERERQDELKAARDAMNSAQAEAERWRARGREHAENLTAAEAKAAELVKQNAALLAELEPLRASREIASGAVLGACRQRDELGRELDRWERAAVVVEVNGAAAVVFSFADLLKCDRWHTWMFPHPVGGVQLKVSLRKEFGP